LEVRDGKVFGNRIAALLPISGRLQMVMALRRTLLVGKAVPMTDCACLDMWGAKWDGKGTQVVTTGCPAHGELPRSGRGIEDVQAPRTSDDHAEIEVCERLLASREILRYLALDETTDHIEGVAALLGQYRKRSQRVWGSRFAAVVAGLMSARADRV
jgi:hypothetical protein